MKKILLLATLVLGMVSCMKDQSLDANLVGDGNFVLSVALPDDATRAAGNDSALGAIDNGILNEYDVRYTLEVYDENDQLAKRDQHTVKAASTSFELRLIPGRHYRFVVWADFVKEGVEPYYNVADLRNVSLSTTAAHNAMNESRDAYTAVFNTAEEDDKEVFSSASTIKMTLKRPFAKLRVVTNDIDELYADLNNATVKYTTPIYSTFNALTKVAGTPVSDVTKSVDFTNEAYLYAGEWTTVNGEQTTVNGKQTLFADYIFGTETGTVQFTLDVDDSTAETIPTIAFNTSIPVERNHLTTIYGPVLTDFNKVTVTIDDDFAQPETVVEQFAGKYNDTLVLSTGTYIFKNLIVETESANAVVVEENANAVVDLVGFARIQSAGKAIYVPASSTLTINGLSATRSAQNGVLEVVGGSGVNSDVNGSAIAVDGKLFINDIASLTAKGYGKCGYGIGGINGEIVIENTTIDYVSGGYVQPLFISDVKYGKSEPEGAAAIGGKKIVISNSVITKAEGGSKAAAIGNRYWESAEVVITNSWLGDIFGGNASAAIGGSRYSSDKATHHEVKVTIENSTIVNAVGGQYGAGIGAGYDTHCQAGGEGSTAVNHIVILKSNVTAQGGKYAAGIGTGFHAAVLTGSIDEESVVNATAGERFYKGTYTYAQHIGYGVVDPAREYLNEVVEFKVDNEVIEEPSVYAGVNEVRNVEEFQTALNGVKAGDNLIVFVENIEGDATVYQIENANVIVDGNAKKYDGTISIEGNNRDTGAETLLIKSVNFETAYAESKSKYFILGLTEGNSYPHNITVDGCSFKNTMDGYTVAGMSFNQFYNLKVVNCESTNLHSLLQAQSCDNTVVVDGVTINGKNGISFGNTMNATIKNSEIVAVGYGVRSDATDAREVSLTVEDCNIEAYIPVVARKLNNTNVKNFNLTIAGTNNFVGETKYQIALGANEFEEGVEPVAPVSEYTLTGTENYVVFPAPPVAMIGTTEYTSIDEAIANWTNGTTLTLVADVTLNDVITLKSTEHHILNLGTYTLTAASGKNAIEITCNARSSASYALTVNADATNPGGITAKGKSCIYYKKSGSEKDRPIILINNGVFTGSYSINSISNGNTNCPQIWINGGVFNSYMNLTKNMLKVSGGTFHAAINCTGDSSAYREFKGGRFKSWQFMTADAPTKFWVGSGNGNYNVGVYVDDEGYLVVGGPVITEFDDRFEAMSTKYSKWSSYLKYSSAAEYGLYYTSAEKAGSGTDVVLNPDKQLE